MKFSHLLSASLIAFAAVPMAAQAQTAAPKVEAAVGATVYDPQGGVVGTITAKTADTIVIDTGVNKATLRSNVLGKDTKGRPIISMTKDQLDAAIAKAKSDADAKLAAALVVGAPVATSDGVQIGTIKEIAADGNIVVDRGDSGLVTLTKAQFTTDAAGKPALLFSKAQLDAALAQQAPAKPAG